MTTAIRKAKLIVLRKLRKDVRKHFGLPVYTSKQLLRQAMEEGGFVKGSQESMNDLMARCIGLDLSRAIRDVKAELPRKMTVRHAAQTHKPMPLLPRHPDYRRDEDFYSSREWRELRYLALKNTEGRCQCCGACSSDGVRIHVDHVQPRYTRPDLSLSLDNLQVLCEDCNFGKGAWDNTDWRARA